MKLARNLVLGLVVLVLVYGSCYRLFLRNRVHDAMLWGGVFTSDSERRWQKFFAPAIEIDFRLTVDRPTREYFQGRWINEETGDFVTIAGNDTCTFHLGGIDYSGQAIIERPIGLYSAEFQHDGVTRYFTFIENDPRESGETRPSATATIGTPVYPLSGSLLYQTTLTHAPAP